MEQLTEDEDEQDSYFFIIIISFHYNRLLKIIELNTCCKCIILQFEPDFKTTVLSNFLPYKLTHPKKKTNPVLFLFALRFLDSPQMDL